MLMNGNGTNQENKKKNAVVFLIAHVLAAAILAAGCSGYDDSKPASDATKEVEMETSDAEITDLTETDDPDLVYSEDTDNTSDDPDAGGHVPVTKVDQITDKVFQNLRAKGEDYFQTSVADTLPDGVTIKDLNYLDIYILKDHEAEEDDENPYVCSLLYQVIFTDETGDATVEDCFFWIAGFRGLYQDGNADQTSMFDPGTKVCFDTWSVNGFESTDSFKDFLWYGRVSYENENNSDQMPLLPVNGKEYESKLPCGGINSLDDLTKGELRFMDEYSRQVFEESYIPDGAALKELELLGQFKSNYAGDYYHYNLVVMVYKAHLTFEEDGETKESVHYWYQGFWNPYYYGEIHLDKPVTPGPDTIKPCGLEVRGCRSMQELYTEMREDYNVKEIDENTIPKDA